ncbi:pentapeptide repeat-containing protein [Pseudovibrio sp. Tun.PSC04-5.I4]|uniref:pentapeptide repeat-containing protein n=1 Tax=Pseudovibrio sp. Tun.PSC04-5.I4 TaxID=1798213 RepID=UPI00088BEC63|nr:pentapeptide repeat-containing protein [Pseudovibrio sp. Tun.PSC04-5.I4]SDR01803.1 Pentapeptide repeat-containing protein [Pseudovibrio sp. Tun.PSC04-5.I4]
MAISVENLELVLERLCGSTNPFQNVNDGSLGRLKENASLVITYIIENVDKPAKDIRNTLTSPHPDIAVLNEKFKVMQMLLDSCSTGAQSRVKNDWEYRTNSKKEIECTKKWNQLKERLDKLIHPGRPETWLVLSRDEMHGRLELFSRVFPVIERHNHVLPKGVDLSHTHLRGANLNSSHFPYASFVNCDLEGVTFNGTSLVHSDFRLARFRRNVFYRCDFRDVNFTGIDYEAGQLDGDFPRNYNIRGLDSAYGNDLFLRDLKDQSYIDTLKREVIDRYERNVLSKGDVVRSIQKADLPWFSRQIFLLQYISLVPYLIFALPIHTLWAIFVATRSRETSLYELRLLGLWRMINYGRDIGKTALISIGVALGFGLLFSVLSLNGFALVNYSDGSLVNMIWYKQILTNLYFSVVTFTTLGFGDVTPVAAGVIGKLVVMWEVVLGYINLGLLISILANKVARRA